MVDRLYDKLVSYQSENYYPMHMPGHKRNIKLMQMMNPYAIDITEIEGFDNLHQREGILKKLSERLAKLYGADHSFPLVNGSTAGILAGISALTNNGDKVLLARNCHKSVYHAVILNELDPVYCYPPQIKDVAVNGGISPAEIEDELIKNKDITLVVITSPTYEGMVSDIRAISKVVHRYGAFLLVDEAHGAHFGFHKDFPVSAVRLGADVVIQSLHKTLPAFTQSAVLHSNIKEFNRKIADYLSIFESSSPSYLLMAGMDRCVSMLEDQAEELFEAYSERLNRFYHSLKHLMNIKLLGADLIGQYNIIQKDPSKITISVFNTSFSGHQLLQIFQDKYHIIMEMAAPDYVLGMTSICDTEEGFERLACALSEIDQNVTILKDIASNKRSDIIIKDTGNSKRPVMAMLPGKAVKKKSEPVHLDESLERVSSVFVCIYPPGSPIIVPGELIDKELIDSIKDIKQADLTITGLCGDQKDQIEVVLN